eukprot:CAMPEP_0197449206 /NCGR_PEP_ID=MMETSP1175-20131217/20391_1 /TAXON_ID=1003142 /ORGANISM="Triceratium dubium, Strain CCMP147" /LENGTH=443 /DNA_ID=CAMNT_0042981249 /DNA_START=22 /DNA_END=1353 /DNA_ORIENTATION=+
MITNASRGLLSRAATVSGATRIVANASAESCAVSATRQCLPARASSHWAGYEMGPPDPIVGLNEAFGHDDFENKVNVGVGAYRGDEGRPFVLPVVRKAEEMMQGHHLDHEYLPIAGDPIFVKLATEFAYGKDSAPIAEGRLAAVQSLSGTGGLRVFGEFLKKGGHEHIYVPDPTWGNHIPIMRNSGLEVRKYSYYDVDTSGLNFEKMMADIKDMPAGSCILLHACAHNPTGMDPSPEQWAEISKAVKDYKLVPFFDCAYQGFASGNAPKDAEAIRMFVEEGHNIALVQSFSKNFGLYGQRVGALSVVCADPEEAKRVTSQLKITIRPMYSNPPKHGAHIVRTILGDEALTAEFIDECKGMADRINDMRVRLRENLEQVGSTRNWEHITKQIGMFAYSGMNKDQVMAIREKHHIYCTLDGRISMAGVTSGNVEYMADAIHDVTK